MTQSHYSLRWNNHQSHMLAAFDALLQAETLVDVTLVCAETSVRAHKMILSAGSPMFQRIFSENPCEHPVIVLKDFSGWEVQAIIDFIYKGEISVVQEQLPSLMKAAESLQVRGLANQDPFGVDKESTANLNQTSTPSTSPNDYDRQPYTGSGKYQVPNIAVKSSIDRSSPFSPISNSYETSVKLPFMPKLSFPETLMPRSGGQSPTPRRKQARPRRRSGELSGPQDLTTGLPKAASPPPEEIAENLCIKNKDLKPTIKDEDNQACSPELCLRSPDLDLNAQSSIKEFRTSPISAPHPPLNLKQEIDSQSTLPFPPMPTVSALAMTPPHGKFFGLDSSLGLFPSGLEGCRNPLFDMTDPRNSVDPPIFVKKKMGRPKGQHSAPRGGPPRSWTNAELTEALQQVWNKKMTTSQASRLFGIPYNSLLMYVRGKYGKSLKLERLRKNCTGGSVQPVDILGNASGNNSNLPQGNEQEQIPPNNRASSIEQDQPPSQHPMFHPFGHNFYPDFGTGFPIPVSMIHLLPQSEKSRTEYNTYGQTAPHDDEIAKQTHTKEMEEDSLIHDLYRTQTLNLDDRRELLQQNGQD